MNAVKLTKSQQAAIEQQKRLFSRIFPDAEYRVWVPRNIPKTILTAKYTIPNCLGGVNEYSRSWTIGKRGKID